MQMPNHIVCCEFRQCSVGYVVALWEVLLYAAVLISSRDGGSALPGPDGRIGWRFVRNQLELLEAGVP